jgi:hypothetical protein
MDKRLEKAGFAHDSTAHNLLYACAELTKLRDVHLECLHGSWQASSCAGVACKGEETQWFSGSTPEMALARLYLYLAEQGGKE